MKKSLKQVLNEAARPASSKRIDFKAFRKLFSDALKAAGAPDDLVADAADEDYEGGPIFGAMWEAWTNMEPELRRISDPAELNDVWIDMSDYIHDAVLDAVDGYNNPLNYDPRRKSKKVDGKALARGVVDAIVSGRVKSTPASSSPTSKLSEITVDDVAAVLATRLQQEGFDVSPFDDAIAEKSLMVYDSQQSVRDVIHQVAMQLESHGVKGQHFRELTPTSFVDESGTIKVFVGASPDLNDPAIDVEITIISKN